MNKSKGNLDFAGKGQSDAACRSDVPCSAAEGSEGIAGHLAATRQNRLDSWKEIAVYLQREIRTVQRWEKSEGLPVHRHYHNKIGTVFAFKEEIGAWSRSRASLPHKPQSGIPSAQNTGNAVAVSAQGISIVGLATDPDNSASNLALFRNSKKGFVPAIIYIDPEAFSHEFVSLRRGARRDSFR